MAVGAQEPSIGVDERVEMTSPNAVTPPDKHQELRLAIGLVMVLVGVATIIGATEAFLSYTAVGISYIIGLSIWVFGVMLVTSSLAVRGHVWATLVFSAIPGALLAGVCYTLDEYIVGRQYPRPTSYSVIAFVLAFGKAAGLMWIPIGPFIAHRIRTTLNADGPRTSAWSQEDRAVDVRTKKSGLVTATWFYGLTTLLGPSIAVLISKLIE